MPLCGHGALVIWHGITPEGDAEMIRWHNSEHVPERVGVPGFLRGRRYRSTTVREYVDLYETESVETIRSAPYLERLNHPTPWTQRVLPHFRHTFRIGCRVVSSVGRGQGGALVTVRLRPQPGRDEALRAWLSGPLLAALREPAGFVGAHLLETAAETTRIQTAEGKLKGGEVATTDEPWPLVLLVECSDVGTAEALVGGLLHADLLAAHGAGADAVAGTYLLQLTMDAE